MQQFVGLRATSRASPASSASSISSQKVCEYSWLFQSWSRNSRFVLTSSKDWNVIVWDLASDIDPPQRKTTIRFDAPVSSASFHPRNRLALQAIPLFLTNILAARLYWPCFTLATPIWLISGKSIEDAWSSRRYKMIATKN